MIEVGRVSRIVCREALIACEWQAPMDSIICGSLPLLALDLLQSTPDQCSCSQLLYHWCGLSIAIYSQFKAIFSIRLFYCRICTHSHTHTLAHVPVYIMQYSFHVKFTKILEVTLQFKFPPPPKPPGVEFPEVPEVGSVPLVCDASSNFLTRPMDVSKVTLLMNYS